MDEPDESHSDQDNPSGEPPATTAAAPVTDPTAGSHRPSRRWFVAGALALVAGGGAGIGVDFARGRPAAKARELPPAALAAALADERSLLAAVRFAGRRGVLDADVARALTRDHEAHLAALVAAASAYATPRRTTSPAGGEPRSRTALRRLEQQAAQHAAGRAGRLSGDTAALLASIAACEATHAEVLS